MIPSSPRSRDLILIVDDVPSNLTVLSGTLNREGYDVAIATSGSRALKQIKRTLPDLVLLDVQMPDIDGFTVCQRMKEDPDTCQIPVIFITASTDVESKVKGFQLGALDYITKPFQHQEVLARVYLHLELRYLSRTLENQNTQLKQLTDELEQRVLERTAELSRSLETLETTQIQLKTANAQLEEYALTLEQKVNERTQQLQKEVAERQQTTEALQRLNQELEVRVEQRTADLRQSQEYLQQLTENIESVFWMSNSSNTEIMYVSPAYERIWGLSRQELYRSPMSWLACIHADDRDRIEAVIAKQVQSGGYDEEYRIIRPDGELRWIHDRAFPIRNEAGEIYRVAGIAEDITAKKQIEETLKLQERAITASNNGIIIVDARLPDNPTIFVNPAFENITGYAAAEVMGQNCRFLEGCDYDQAGLQELRLALKNQQSCKVSLRNYRKDGSLFWNELSVSPIYNDTGKLTHYIGIQTDISDSKRAEEQIKASLQEKEVLLKEIHHRVKNNLLVVASLLDWQSDYVTDPAILKIFVESQHRIYSMALIHEKLYQSQNLERVDLGEYLKMLTEHLINSFNLDLNKIQFHYHLEPIYLNIETATPCGLIVGELVANTLEHAFKDNGGGQVELEVRQTDEGQVSVFVRDNGVGFPEEIDFRNTESLGLQLVCLLTQQLNGTLELNHEQGTEFQLTFTELNYCRRL